jgi:hypothetical protein
MKIARITLVALYAGAAALVLLAGVIYPQLKEWSYWAGSVCALHGLLSLIVASIKIADAGRIAAWYWLGVSSLISACLLFLFFRSQQRGWLLATAALFGFTLLVTLVLSLVLKPDAAGPSRPSRN